MLELRRAGRPERMGGNYFNYGYYLYWSSIILALYPYQKSIEFIDYLYYSCRFGSGWQRRNDVFSYKNS